MTPKFVKYKKTRQIEEVIALEEVDSEFAFLAAELPKEKGCVVAVEVVPSESFVFFSADRGGAKPVEPEPKVGAAAVDPPDEPKKAPRSGFLAGSPPLSASLPLLTLSPEDASGFLPASARLSKLPYFSFKTSRCLP